MAHKRNGIPKAGPERERLRQKGQFWTPDWVSEAMVSYVLAENCTTLFDPAVGAGAFFRTAKSIACAKGMEITLLGAELDPTTIQQARENGLTGEDLRGVEIRDFALRPPHGPFGAIVANPPYIRHHRLSPETKTELRKLSIRLIGKPLDGRAGLHIYFLLRALELLEVDGRLAFIMPSDTCEGVFAKTLWDWITKKYKLEIVVTFSPESSPFPGVDTNPIIFMIKNASPVESFVWAKCIRGPTDALKKWVLSGFGREQFEDLSIYSRSLSEALETGLSRMPAETESTSLTLGDVAKVVRGIATGANEFFFLTRDTADSLEIADEFLIPAIGRTRDVPGSEITVDTLKELESRGRPTLLFSPDGRPLDAFPIPTREYLGAGGGMYLNKRPLIATRKPWYKMEKRVPPPILFAYLGRRNTRFIRNRAGVVPLTGFLCVYPYVRNPDSIEKLWGILNHPQTISNLALVGKSYGLGAIKVEPRALEKLPLPSLIPEKELRQLIRPKQSQLLATASV